MFIHVLLDLDNTILHTIDDDINSLSKHNKNKIKTYPHSYHIHPEGFIIFERPHTQDFLDVLFKYFFVSVYTAGTKSYAQYIIRNIIKKKPGRNLVYLFHRHHVQMLDRYFEKKNKIFGHKNLKLLYQIYKPKIEKMIPLSHTYIIDNNKYVSVKQKDKHIPVKDFNVLSNFSEYDNELHEKVLPSFFLRIQQKNNIQSLSPNLLKLEIKKKCCFCDKKAECKTIDLSNISEKKLKEVYICHHC